MTIEKLTFLLSIVAALCIFQSVAVLADTPISQANATVFGKNVYVFDPGMSSADIQRTASDIFRKMETNQFGADRYALLFKPGTYNVDLLCDGSYLGGRRFDVMTNEVTDD